MPWGSPCGRASCCLLVLAPLSRQRGAAAPSRRGIRFCSGVRSRHSLGEQAQQRLPHTGAWHTAWRAGSPRRMRRAGQGEARGCPGETSLLLLHGLSPWPGLLKLWHKAAPQRCRGRGGQAGGEPRGCARLLLPRGREARGSGAGGTGLVTVRRKTPAAGRGAGRGRGGRPGVPRPRRGCRHHVMPGMCGRAGPCAPSSQRTPQNLRKQVVTPAPAKQNSPL